jgi:hypothetical protein
MTRAFTIRPSTVFEKFDQETVILNLDSGSYFSAEGTASVIWGLVADGVTEAGIIDHLTSGFAGEFGDIAASTGEFLNRLVEESLVDEKPAPADERVVAEDRLRPGQTFSPPVLQKYTDMEEMLLLDPIHEVDEHGWPNARKPPA